MIDLADIISSTTGELPRSAVVDNINNDGTVDLFYMGGQVYNVPVLSTYQPVSGDVVQIMRRGNSLIILGVLRATNNLASSTVQTDFSIVYNVAGTTTTQAGSSGTFTFSATSSGSYRTADRWGDRNELRQGAYFSSTRFGYYQGEWWYGSFADLRGRDITRVRITMRRRSGSGVFSAEPISLWTTKNATKPSGAPYYVKKIGTYKLAVGDTGTFDLPTWVGEHLRSGAARGLGIRDNSTANYLALDGTATYAQSGQLLIGWRD